MKSTLTPAAKLGNTISATTVDFTVGRTQHSVDVPAGIQCAYLEGGSGSGRWVVDDLSFLDKASGIYTDAENYGIPVNADNVGDQRAPTVR
ncbi:hypothetical protein [Pseudomonas abietaniphila]|uniref:Uncharacterized protein n=1 Tax=Pseudomonas abietaniphila TaxID=89065 RepID=A0A1G8QQ27_9PSED|nr:hypothetical protein [Pseudomonas abietaniphila]SDJ06763.1 hypothetical protein SAMN05216605_12124 [Pseudomonas abietaniphila]